MRSALFTACMCLIVLVLFAPGNGLSQQADSSASSTQIPQAAPTEGATTPPGAVPAPPTARKIPGITAPDEFPTGCVSCHINMPDRHMDARISTLVKEWTQKVEPKLLDQAQATAPAGVTLKGKHPAITSALRDIPAGCMKCHGRDAKKAPPFVRLMHRIHLTGGDENHFMTQFQGECTPCHKLDMTTGAWSIPSAPEP